MTQTTGTDFRRAFSTKVCTFVTTRSRSKALLTTPFCMSTTSSAGFGRQQVSNQAHMRAYYQISFRCAYEFIAKLIGDLSVSFSKIDLAKPETVGKAVEPMTRSATRLAQIGPHFSANAAKHCKSGNKAATDPICLLALGLSSVRVISEYPRL
jgi:hypothetical protein